MGTGYPEDGGGGLSAAIRGDLSAQLQMLRPWLGESADEPVLFAQCLGRHGGWPFGAYVFAYLTSQRLFVVKARGTRVSQVSAADLLALRQLQVVIPSWAGIWVLVCLVLAAVIPSYGASLLLLPFLPYLHARWSPLGLRCIGRGVDFWCPASRHEVQQLHQLFRMTSEIADGLRQREQGVAWECPYAPVLPVGPMPAPETPTPVAPPVRARAAAGGAAVNASAGAGERAAAGPATVVTTPRRAASPLQEAERLLSAGDSSAARRVLDGVPAADRGVEFDRLYSRTIPRAGTELEELQGQFQRLMSDRQFAGRERLAKRILELSPQDQKAAAELQALRGRRETLRGILQKCGGRPPAPGSEDHTKLEWMLKAMDPEAEPLLAEQCRRLIGAK